MEMGDWVKFCELVSKYFANSRNFFSNPAIRKQTVNAIGAITINFSGGKIAQPAKITATATITGA